jgi:DAACS family dicarboxylate/amino acid:cation (Na+ or H+) symporter
MNPQSDSAPSKAMPLHTRMLIGFVVGVVAGIAAKYWFADSGWLQGVIIYVTQPVGQVFLRLLFMLVVPLVFSALVLGVTEIGDAKSLGRIGMRTLVYVVAVTGVAVIIGLVAANVAEPGRGLPAEVGTALLNQGSERSAAMMEKAATLSGLDLVVNIVPESPIRAAAANDLIGVMFFALLIAIAATVTPTEGTRTFVGALQGVYDISLKLIGWIIQLAPYAVAALLFTLTARLGLDVLVQLARFVGTVIAALAVHMFVVFPLLVWFFGGRSPWAFFKDAEPALLTAFSTSSSSATLPTTLKVAEEGLRVPRHIARFVCTLGATANMNGTALFEGITVLFLAQFFGVELTLGQQVLILLLCVFGGIGAAGVPGGSLPVIATFLVMFGIPAEGIGIILGVDRLLDMCRTTVNVTGDLVGCVVIAHAERNEPAPAMPPV